MHHVEAAGRDPVEGGRVGGIDMGAQPGIAPVLEARKALLVVDRAHRIEGKARVAVAGGEQHHVVAPRGQPLGEVPAIGFEPAREGRRDRMAQMGEERVPHAGTASCTGASRASMARMTEAELV